MQTRTRAAGTALVLAVSVTGLAATGSAQATTHHSPSRSAAHSAARSAATQTVRITSRKQRVDLSTDSIRPGKTMFKVYRGNAGGSMQVLRLRKGFSLQQAEVNFGKAFSPKPNVAKRAVRKVDKNIVFYGGMDVPRKDATKPTVWGVKLDKDDTYYVLNLNRNTLSPLQVTGAPRKGTLPATNGVVSMAGAVGANRFVTPASEPHKGWMKTTNNAHEPHFVELNQVQEGTKNKDVNEFIDSGAQGAPSWALPAGTDTGLISPGHTFVWKYHLPKGEYIVLCFWTSKTTGMPHFLMKMYRLFHLT